MVRVGVRREMVKIGLRSAEEGIEKESELMERETANQIQYLLTVQRLRNALPRFRWGTCHSQHHHAVPHHLHLDGFLSPLSILTMCQSHFKLISYNQILKQLFFNTNFITSQNPKIYSHFLFHLIHIPISSYISLYFPSHLLKYLFKNVWSTPIIL